MFLYEIFLTELKHFSKNTESIINFSSFDNKMLMFLCSSFDFSSSKSAPVAILQRALNRKNYCTEICRCSKNFKGYCNEMGLWAKNHY